MLNKTEMKKQKQELACMEKFQQQNIVPKLDTTLTKDPQRKDKLVPQDQNNETVHFSDVSAQRHSQRNRFHVDDDLYFKYKKQEDSVLLVTQAAYETCNTSNPIVIKLCHSGPFYFISGIPENCDKGRAFLGSTAMDWRRNLRKVSMRILNS